MKTTLKRWFDDFTAEYGETPTHIVFGKAPPNAGGWNNIEWPEFIDDIAGVVMTFDTEAVGQMFPLQDILNVEFDGDYGGNESPNFCAWSESYVIFSDDYDGAEGWCAIPRSPRPHTPIRPGGGGQW